MQLAKLFIKIRNNVLKAMMNDLLFKKSNWSKGLKIRKIKKVECLGIFQQYSIIMRNGSLLNWII